MMKWMTSLALMMASVIQLGTSLPCMAADKGHGPEKVFGEPREDQALVYFLREGNFTGGGSTSYVFSETQLVTVLQNNSYNFAYMSPGRHVLWWGGPYPGLEVEFEAGEVYYIDLTITMKRRDRFIDEQTASDMLENIERFYEPTEKNREKADKMVRKNYAKAQALPPEVAGKYCPYPEEMFPILQSQTIAIRPIELQATSEYPQEVTDDWARELPRLIAKALSSRGYEKVEYTGAEDRGAADVIVGGSFVVLKQGSGMARYFGTAKAKAKAAAFMRVDFSIAPGSDPGNPVTIPCARTGYGVGGVLFGAMSASSKRIMHNNMERIAGRLAEIVAQSATPSGKRK